LSFYYDQFTLEESLITGRAILFGLIAFSLAVGIRFSQKRTLFFDLEEERYKNQISVGPFKKGKWQYLPSLKYISVMGAEYSFSVNLWYGRNQHINLFIFWSRKKAFKTAFKIADQLNIKLLDTTRKNNYRYLNMEELRKKYKA